MSIRNPTRSRAVAERPCNVSCCWKFCWTSTPNHGVRYCITPATKLRMVGSLIWQINSAGCDVMFASPTRAAEANRLESCTYLVRQPPEEVVFMVPRVCNLLFVTVFVC